MVGVFAAATARLTPEFLESFDPEKLASKFVRLEREFGVKFTKSKSTFSIVGQWEGVRNAHRSLLKLKFSEKCAEKCSTQREKCKEKPKTADSAAEAPALETDNNENSYGVEPKSSDSVLPLYRGKGNPKRGRYATKESMYSAVPEPVFFLQYQDKTFSDADNLDIDSVLEDFEKSQLDKKVTKEELKKILEKNKDQMGKPLEKGIPKGAIIPVPKQTEQNFDCNSLNSTSQSSASSGVYRNSDQNFINSYHGYMKTEQMTQNQTMSSVESLNPLNSAMITTYSVNARMSTYNMDMMTNSNQDNGAGTPTVSQINVEDFYNHHPVEANDRLVQVTGVFANGQCNASEQMQLPESETDSFCGIFENYDPQSVLNPIPSSGTSLNDSEEAGTSLQSVDEKPAVCDTDIPGHSESDDVNMKGESVSCIGAGIKSDFTASPLIEDNIQFETNGVKSDMNGYEEMTGATAFEEFTEIPANSSDLPVVQINSSVADYFNNPSAPDMSDAQTQLNKVGSHTSLLSEIDTNKNNSIISTTKTVHSSSSGLISMPTEAVHSNSVLISMPTEMELIERTQVSMTADINCSSYPSVGLIQTGCHRSISKTIAELTNTVTPGINAGSLILPYSEIKQVKDGSIGAKQVDVSMATQDENQDTCPISTDNTDRTADTREEAEKETGNLLESLKVEEAVEMASKENEERSIYEGTPHVARECSDHTEIVRSKDSELNERKTGKIKKSRVSKNVKTKVEEKDKVKKKRGRKPKSAGTGQKNDIGSSDLKGTTNEETLNESTGESKKNKDFETSEQRSQNNAKSNVKEKVKRAFKRKEDKGTGDIREKQIYKCTECDYQGYRKKRLTEHMGRVHGLLSNGTQPENPMFTCDECEKTFVFEKDLNRHKKIVHHGQVFVCLICHKNYKSKYVFDRHSATHEEGYIQPKFRCQICEREFTTKFSLSSHIKSEHLGMKKTYSCPTCGKTFSQIRSYRQHANVHAGIRPYTCEVCGKSFTYDKSLKEHRYMHDTVRRFQCTVCQKAFRQQTCLLIHMKTHKEKKDHICSVCGREFTQKQSLLRHERIHTGDKPYSCKICFKSFGDYAVIRKHVMMAHKKSKDSWKNEIFTEEKKRSSHYIDGGPGYVPRESYAKLHQKNQAAVMHSSAPGGQIMIAPLGQEPHMISGPSQQIFDSSLEDAIQRRQQHCEMSASSQGDLNALPHIYQASTYSDTLDFSVMETLKPKQEENYTPVVNVPVNYSLIQSVEGDAFSNLGSQQPNLNIKTYPYSLTISPTVKATGVSGDAYAAQFLNSPATASAVSLEPSSVSMTEVQDQMLISSTANCSVAIGDPAVSGTPVTMVTTNNGWVYPSYSAAYFSPASFSQYQSSPDT